MKRSEIVILAFAGLILAFGFSFISCNQSPSSEISSIKTNMKTSSIIKLVIFIVIGLVSFFFTDKQKRKHQIITSIPLLLIGGLGLYFGLDSYFKTNSINLLLFLMPGFILAGLEELFHGALAEKLFNYTKKNETEDKDAQPKPTSSEDNISKKRKKKLVCTIGGLLIIILVLLTILYRHQDSSYNKMNNDVNYCTSIANWSENKIKQVINSYCEAIVNNDFETLSKLYAPKVERYQAAENKDREYVIGCHKRYDKKFKVTGKHSSIRWDTFQMFEDGELVCVSVIEDYSIDRQEKNKKSVFILQKNFVLDENYQIVSVYDKQIENEPEDNIACKILAAESYNYVLKEYKGGHDDIWSVGIAYGKVDFRNCSSFVQLIKSIVGEGRVYETMMSDDVVSTEYSDGSNGKLQIFDMQGHHYNIYFVELFGEYNIIISVDGKKYQWETPEYSTNIERIQNAF